MQNAVPLAWSADGRELAVVRIGAPPSLTLIDASGHRRALTTALPPSPFAGAWLRGIPMTLPPDVDERRMRPASYVRDLLGLTPEIPEHTRAQLEERPAV